MMNANTWIRFFFQSLAVLILLLGQATPAPAAPRQAAVYFSDGNILTGRIALTSGRKFKLNVPEAGKLRTTDMVTGEPVQYGKVRQFTFEPVKEIRFYPEKEQMRQDWKFVEKTKYDEKTAVADYTPAKKEFWGQLYPLRYLFAEVVFSSGETLEGHLYSVPVYLETEQKTHRLLLLSKQRGKKGTKLDDLVYVTRIKMLDKGQDIAADITITFTGTAVGPDDVVQAVTRDSLTPVPTERGKRPGTFVVKSAFGEDFYIAVKKKGRYIVGWPSNQDQKLFALAQDYLQRQRDFYNDKKLLGVITSTDGKEILTLVNLRRRFAPTHFGEIGGEWDKELGRIVEPWRLSIWRWKYDPVNQDLLLSSRGTFFRVIFLPEDPTPEVAVSEDLWQMRRENDVVYIGTPKSEQHLRVEP
ncbi:MAG: hypothetical protein JSW66_04600 [Phycisphaerales bacterium]|nr:MAG: hypothetical protein JSW66_04600 [Phycisphaerales bacterium]